MEYLARLNKAIYSWCTIANILSLIQKVCAVTLAYLIGYWIMIPEYSENFWWNLIKREHGDQRIAIYGLTNRIGEHNLHLRLIKAAKALKIDFVAIALDDRLTGDSVFKPLYTLPINLLHYIFKPQMNLASTHLVNYLPAGYNIVYLDVPTSMLMDENHHFLNDVRYLYEYDAYADVYSLVHGKNDYLIQTLSRKKQKFDIYHVYFGDNYREYTPAKYETALITGSLWGCARNNQRVRRALKHLAEDQLLYGLGLQDLAFLNKGYLGTTAQYAKDPVFVLSEFQKLHGISIVLTTLEHMIEGIPTLRIAEASAAANLIISDYNLFVRKFYGNNVLYIDIFQNETNIAHQIKQHILWARTHPAEAKLMAESSYKIFAEHFYIEKQLKDLIEAVQKRSR
jgi:hypothetical protein